MDNFEKKLETLENLSEQIKNNNLPLEEALNIFEQGIKLAKGMEKELAKIESKIQILMNQPDIEVDSDSEQETESTEKPKTKTKPKLDLFPTKDLFSDFEE